MIPDGDAPKNPKTVTGPGPVIPGKGPGPEMRGPRDGDDCGLATMIRDVDIIIGGHSHTNLEEPTVINDLDGKPVIIVQDYRWGLYVGEFKVTL